MERMKLKGIQTSFHYPPIYDFTAYKEQYGDLKIDFKITQEVVTREVTLPLYPTLSNSQVDYVVQSVNEILHPVKVG